MFQLTLTQESALGAGTRQPGETLGLIELAEGISIGEFLTAIRNPHLSQVTVSEPEVEKKPTISKQISQQKGNK